MSPAFTGGRALQATTLVAAAGFLAVSLAAPAAAAPAPMHMHMPAPSSATASTTGTQAVLATPGVAWVEAIANYQVVVRTPTGLAHGNYAVPFLGSTGSFVNFNGVLVTSLSKDYPTEQAQRREAVNKAFHDAFGIPLPADVTADQQLADPTANRQLHGCYTNAADSECAIFLTRSYRVWPYAASPSPQGLPADLLATNGGLVTLRIGGVQPTQAVSTSPGTGHVPVFVVGFPMRATKGVTPAVVASDLMIEGNQAHLEELSDANKMLGRGLFGAAIIDKTSGSMIGVFTGDGADGGGVKLSTQVTALLSKNFIAPARSAVDTDFAVAEEYFQAHHYAHAAENLADVLRLDAQHPVAATELPIAKAKAGTAEDLSNQDESMAGPQAPAKSSSGSLSWWEWLLIAAGAVLLVIAGFLVSRWNSRRRPSPPGSASTPGAPLPPPRFDSAASSRTPGAAASNPGAGSSARSAAPVGGAGGEGTTQLVDAPAPANPTFRKQRHCTQCAAQLSPDARFCGYCAAPTGK